MNATTLKGIPPILPGLFGFRGDNEDSPVLLGGYCPQCQKHFYPRPRRCHYCLDPLDEVELGNSATIYSFTIIRKKAPFGLPVPYGVGFVDLDGCGLRIFCLFDPATLEHLAIGQKVTLSVGVLGHDGNGNPCLRPFFAPLTGGQ